MMTVEELQAVIVDGLAAGRIQPDSEIVVGGMDRENLVQKALRILRLAEQNGSVKIRCDYIGPVLEVHPDDDGRLILLCITPVGWE